MAMWAPVCMRNPRHRPPADNWWTPFEYHRDPICALIDSRRASWRYQMYLGLNGKHELVAAERDSPLLVVGPPAAAKTSSGLIPNALLAPGALVAISSRADIYTATARARARLGKIWHFSAYGNTVPGATEVRFSPLQGCEDESQAHKVALRLASFVDRSEFALRSSNHGHLHFRNHAQSVLFALFHIAAVTDRGMGWVFKTLTSPSFTKTLVELTRELETHPDAGRLEAAINALTWVASISPDERGSALSTAAHAISAYRDPQVVKNSEGAKFDFDAFVRGEPDKTIQGAEGFDDGVLGRHGCYPPMRGMYGSVYVTDASSESPAAIVYSDFEYRVREAAYKLSLERELASEAKPMPVTILSDEAAVNAPIFLSQLLAEMRDRGVQFAMGLQDLEQASLIWGELASAFPTLFRTMMLYRGIKSEKTLNLASMLSGQYWQDITSRSVTHGKDRSEGTSTGPQLVGSLRPEQIARGHPRWQEDGALVINSQAKTFWVRTTPYWRGEPWPRLLIRHLARSIDDETLLPLPRLERPYLDELGLTNAYELLKTQFSQYGGSQ